LQFGKTILFTGNSDWPDEQIVLAYRSQYHIENAFKQMKNPHFLGMRFQLLRKSSPMYHWTDSKIQVHAFYCVLALLLTSLLQCELARKGEPISINRRLEELGGIRETLIVYPRCQGQKGDRFAPGVVHAVPAHEIKPTVLGISVAVHIANDVGDARIAIPIQNHPLFVAEIVIVAIYG
jgi:hypothetical protein